MFKETARAEAKYFQNIKSLIETLKKWRQGENPSKTEDILDSCIEANKALILLYKNVGEVYNELVSLFVKQQGELIALRDYVHALKDELNEKIDDVNNYLNGRLTELEGRVEAVEQSLSDLWEAFRALHRIYIYKIKYVSINQYKIYLADGTTEASYSDARTKLDANYILFAEYTANGITRLYTMNQIYNNRIEFLDVYYYADTQRLIASRFTWNELGTVTLSATYWELNQLVTDVAQLKIDVADLLAASTWYVREYQIPIVASFWTQDPVTLLYQYELPDALPTDDLYIYTSAAGGNSYDDVLDSQKIMRDAGVFVTYTDDPKHLLLNATTIPAGDFKIIIKREKYVGNADFGTLNPAHIFIIQGV